MKTLHLSIIMIFLICLLFIPSYLKSIQADNTVGIEIKNIQVQPVAIKVGDTFTVNATLVNNSKNPIDVVVPHCSIPSFVIFDIHVIVEVKQTLCEDYLMTKMINPGEKFSIVYPIPKATFRAASSGTANSTVTFSYFEAKTDFHKLDIKKTISKSFLFTIYDNNAGTKRITENVLSPLKQFKSGISLDDITCKDGFFLAISNEKNPLCLKPETISKLASRGFFYGINSNEIKTNYTTILIPPGSENSAANKSYSPNLVKIMIGINNTVRWVNQSPDTGNTVVEDINDQNYGKTFNSSLLKPRQSYEFTFTQSGTYHYHGEPHPWQTGTVIVLTQSHNGTQTPTFSSLPTKPDNKITRLVFFMKQNSTLKIYVKYSSDQPGVDANSKELLGGGFYTGNPNNFIPINSSKLIVTSNPDSISIRSANLTAVYTIAAQNITPGIYWLSLTQICEIMPVAIGIDSSQISPSDIPVWSGGCPAIIMEVQILGISSGIAEYKPSSVWK